MSLRGVLRGFGLKVGQTTPRTFAGRIRELVAGHADAVDDCRGTAGGARHAVRASWQKLEKRLRSTGARRSRVRLLMTTPGVGPIVALTYARRRSTIPAASDPRRRWERISG